MRSIVGIDPYEINQVYGIISFLPVEKQAMIIYGWIASEGEGTEAIYDGIGTELRVYVDLVKQILTKDTLEYGCDATLEQLEVSRNVISG